MKLRLVLTMLSVVSAACAGKPPAKVDRVFTNDWQNDGGKSIASVQRRLAAARLPEGAAVAVGVTRSGLVGIGLDGSGKWQSAAVVDARPALSGDVVVATGGGNVFALEARTGKRLWNVSSRGRALLGAGDDGKLTVASLAMRTGGGSLLLAIDRSGKLVRQLEPSVEIGVPAVLGGIAFVPWSGQYVSAIELATGSELARLPLRDQVSHALNIGGTMYFGQTRLVRFDEAIGHAGAGGARAVSLPIRDLPGSPQWLSDGNMVNPAAATARSRIQLYARPSVEGDRLGIQNGRFVATYFRIAMGLDAGNAVLRWVRTSQPDILGGAAALGGFALCGASGRVWLLDENGADAGEAQLGKPVDACVVQAGAYSVRAGKPAGTLVEQIVEALAVRDGEMAIAQRSLMRELGALQDPKVTKVLIDFASDARTAPLLLQEARSLLGARRSGKEYMLEALAKHYDFLSDVLRPPPVGPLADALAAMNAKEATPLLAEHLNDPANTPDDVERAARALATLATPKELDELRTFFSLYRATADQQELVNAVISAARALLQVGGDVERRLIERAAEDPLTQPDVQRGLAALVQRTEPSAIGAAR